jgi:hypothetical protein
MKWLTITASSILALILISLAVIYFGFTFILEKNLSEKVATKLTIEDSGLSLNSIELDNLRIHNPKNMIEPYALEIETINIQAPILNYFKKIVEIELIELNNIVLSIEFLTDRKTSSNWSYIMKSVNKKGSSAPPENDTSYTNIDLLSLKNITVIVIVAGKEQTRKVIPSLTFRNIKTKKGELTRRVTQAILYNLLFDFKNLLDFSLDFIPEGAEEPLNLFDKLLPNF